MTATNNLANTFWAAALSVVISAGLIAYELKSDVKEMLE